MRQSAASWFQPASADSANASPISSSPKRLSRTPSGSAARGSEGAITAIVVRRLADAAHAASDPVGDPVDHAAERHAGIAEQAMRLGAVDEPAGRRLTADEMRRLAEALAERDSKRADADRLGPADIEGRGRPRDVAERAQHHAVGVALPDHVDMAGGEIDGLAHPHLLRHVVQHAITHVDGVIEPNEAARRTMEAREILEHALAPDAGIGIGAARIRGRGLAGAAMP